MLERLRNLKIDPEDLVFRDQETLRNYLNELEEVEIQPIGVSRQSQELFGMRFGQGSRNVSVIAGCHADEPIGPMTAQALPRLLHTHFPELLKEFRFHVVPQMNPDGADRNRAWFERPFDLKTYLIKATRELPGDDIEFGFGSTSSTRPEALAAQQFLKPHAPYDAHFSLHGMGFAEGAWCLLCKEWREKAIGYMDAFSALCTSRDFPLHDIDRGGEKGFSRIREGFTTTPHSVAMKEFFMAQGDPAMADLFLPSSMEWVQSLGGDPLCIVSELPIFLVGKRSPSLAEPIGPQLKEALLRVRARREIDEEALNEVIDDYRLSPVAPETQVPLQLGMIVLALGTSAQYRAT